MENEQKSFAAQVVADEEKDLHSQEIKRTRVGGLGGSDAAIVLRIAEKGIANLSATDLNRLCVLCGVSEQSDWGENAYTKAGHAFEDYAEQILPWGAVGYEREKVMSAKLAVNFDTFAHADFVTGNEHMDVIECKYVQGSTSSVANKYWAQLQWYYMLGAKSVRLYHGVGEVEPFEVIECKLQEIERDTETINMLLNGIKILDDALSAGWRPAPVDKVIISDTPKSVQEAFAAMAEIKRQEKEIAAKKEEASAILKTYCEDWGYSSILAEDGSKSKITYQRATISKTFDSVAFLKDHPEYNALPQYWKTAKRASSISFR